jgi:hypothetical protein
MWPETAVRFLKMSSLAARTGCTFRHLQLLLLQNSKSDYVGQLVNPKVTHLGIL